MTLDRTNMGVRMLSIKAIVLMLAGFAAQAAPSEWSAPIIVPGFVVGFEQGNGQQSILEQVPKGETVDSWTRMLTSQRFIGRSADPGPTQMLVNIQGLLRRACPGGTTTSITELTVSGQPAARMRSDCPRNPDTGKPETFFIIAFAGANDLFSEQVAFRRVPTQADVSFAEDVLNSVQWCSTGSTSPACAKRR
jgi:hypothetical protein